MNVIDNQLFIERHSHNFIFFTTMAKGHNQAYKNTLSYEKKSFINLFLDFLFSYILRRHADMSISS